MFGTGEQGGVDVMNYCQLLSRAVIHEDCAKADVISLEGQRNPISSSKILRNLEGSIAGKGTSLDDSKFATSWASVLRR